MLSGCSSRCGPGWPSLSPAPLPTRTTCSMKLNLHTIVPRPGRSVAIGWVGWRPRKHPGTIIYKGPSPQQQAACLPTIPAEAPVSPLLITLQWSPRLEVEDLWRTALPITCTSPRAVFILRLCRRDVQHSQRHPPADSSHSWWKYTGSGSLQAQLLLLNCSVRELNEFVNAAAQVRVRKTGRGM